MRQDQDADAALRQSGALDQQGNWKRRELAERALTAFSGFVSALPPDVAALFRSKHDQAWMHFACSYEVGAVARTTPFLPPNRVSLQAGRVTVWCGPSPVLVRDVPAPAPSPP